MPTYQYDPGTPKKKHHWEEDEPAIVRRGRELVAMCPNNVTNAEAAAQLVNAVPWSPPDWDKPWPKRLYNLFRGIVYRATHTLGGTSYHAFPEREGDLPASVRRQLSERAAKTGSSFGFAPEVEDES